MKTLRERVEELAEDIKIAVRRSHERKTAIPNAIWALHRLRAILDETEEEDDGEMIDVTNATAFECPEPDCGAINWHERGTPREMRCYTCGARIRAPTDTEEVMPDAPGPALGPEVATGEWLEEVGRALWRLSAWLGDELETARRYRADLAAEALYASRGRVLQVIDILEAARRSPVSTEDEKDGKERGPECPVCRKPMPRRLDTWACRDGHPLVWLTPDSDPEG